MRYCGTIGLLLRDPRADVSEALGSVYLENESLGAVLSSYTTGGLESAMWQPVNGLRGYRLELTGVDGLGVRRLNLIEVPGGTLSVVGLRNAIAPGMDESIDDLVASVQLVGGDGPQPLPEPGGWCAGDNYVASVPDGWFAGEACRWLNTSSESPEVLACECLPPLWVEHGSLPLDADFGFSRVDVDEFGTRVDGTPIRIIEGLRRDPNNMDRPIRAVIVDGGVERVSVVSTRFPEHALPGHSWQDTLVAQAHLVDTLRFHSQGECAAEDEPIERLIATADEGPFVEIEISTETHALPSGSAVLATGCTRDGPRGPQSQVRVEARPAAIGWVDDAVLVPFEVQLCPSAEARFNPQAWEQELVGDFDGDGRQGWLYVRASDPEWAASDELHDQVPDVAILFANGGLATAATGRVGTPSVERFIGMGRDVVGLSYDTPTGTAWTVYSVVDCQLEPIFEAQIQDDESVRAGFCRFSSALSDSLRSWEEAWDIHQGWVTVLDQRWGPSTSYGATDRALSAQAGAVACGPTLAGPLAPVVERPTTPTFAGDYELTLQWLTRRANEPGTIRFESIGGARYEVTGSQITDEGEITIIGVMEVRDPSLMTFEGTIQTYVPRLNGGDRCVRNAEQQFVRRENTNTYRLQDRINCDGARTDVT